MHTLLALANLIVSVIPNEKPEVRPLTMQQESHAAQWQAQGGRCFHCGHPLTLKRLQSHRKSEVRAQLNRDRRDWSVDHFLPQHLAPRHDPYYQVISCGPCNARKGDTVPSLLDLVSFVEMRSYEAA